MCLTKEGRSETVKFRSARELEARLYELLTRA